MDVSETDYTNVNSVNFLCLIWGVMCWSLLKHVEFPKNVPLNSTKKEKLKEKVPKSRNDPKF